MKKEKWNSVSKEKAVIGVCYFFLIAISILSWILNYPKNPAEFNRIGLYLDDIIISLGILKLFTIVQAVLFYKMEETNDFKLPLLFILALLKFIVSFGSEFALEWLNLMAFQPYEIIYVLFLCLLFAVAIFELHLLLKIKEKKL